jgi:hypothetical protein
MKVGQRVKWTYTHYLNHRSQVRITKEGELYGLVKHTCRYKGKRQLAYVLFDGNKGLSSVPFCELEDMPEDRESK